MVPGIDVSEMSGRRLNSLLSQQGAEPKAGKQKGQKDTMPSGEGRSGSVPQGGPGTQKRAGRLELKKEEREEWEYGTGRAFCKHHDAPGYCVCVCTHRGV